MKDTITENLRGEQVQKERKNCQGSWYVLGVANRPHGKEPEVP